MSGAPDTIRTCDLCLRRVALYPAELRAQCLAVQRPNESNPLGLCCDIVKPVLGGVLSHLAWQSRAHSPLRFELPTAIIGDLFPRFEVPWNGMKSGILAVARSRSLIAAARRLKVSAGNTAGFSVPSSEMACHGRWARPRWPRPAIWTRLGT